MIIIKLTGEALPAEVLVGFVVIVVILGVVGIIVATHLNRNSPRLGMGLEALNEPSVLFVILKIFSGGSVTLLGLVKSGPLSVPESYGGNMVTFQVSRHLPLSQRSWLSIPTYQSGDGASMLIKDTLGKSEVTST